MTIASSGGTVTGSAYGASIAIDVPAGSFPNGGQVVVTASSPCSVDVGSALKVVADFGVVVLDPDNGQKLSGPFSPAIVVTIADPSIVAGDNLVVLGPPGHVTPVPGAEITSGQATAMFSSQPGDLAVISLGEGTSGFCPPPPQPVRPPHRTSSNAQTVRHRGGGGWFEDVLIPWRVFL